MIGEFQTRILKVPKPDRKIIPDGVALKQLRAGMTPGLSSYKLQAIMAESSLAQTNRYFSALSTAMAANQINTPLRTAHFLAQVGHESGDLRYSEEIATGEAYEGRADLGNTQPGDGARFKGRGLIQLTGRSNYTRYGAARKRDFVTGANNLLLSSDANLAVDVSCWFWTEHGLNEKADADDLNGITHKINGGLNGLADRVGAPQTREMFTRSLS